MLSNDITPDKITQNNKQITIFKENKEHRVANKEPKKEKEITEKEIRDCLIDLEFISTFQPYLKPSFGLKTIDCSSLFNSFIKYYYYGEDRETTYKIIYNLLNRVDEFLKKLDTNSAYFCQLYLALENISCGLNNLYRTYPTKDFRFLIEYFQLVARTHNKTDFY